MVGDEGLLCQRFRSFSYRKHSFLDDTLLFETKGEPCIEVSRYLGQFPAGWIPRRPGRRREPSRRKRLPTPESLE